MDDDANDGYYDDGEMPEGAEWCDRCQGSGIADCHCGGDQCYCQNQGEMDCPTCGGDGYWMPTPSQIKARDKTAEFMRRLWNKEPENGQA